MYNSYLREDDAVGTRQSAVFVAYLKARLPVVSFHLPFRHTYGMAVWLATPIMPLWGHSHLARVREGTDKLSKLFRLSLTFPLGHLAAHGSYQKKSTLF